MHKGQSTRIAVPKTVEFQASLLPQSLVPLVPEPPSVMDNFTVSESNNMAENSTSSAQASIASSPISLTEEVANDQIASSDNGGELQELGVDFVDQNVLERELMAKVKKINYLVRNDIELTSMNQADKAINAREDELDEKRLVKTAKEIEYVYARMFEALERDAAENNMY